MKLDVIVNGRAAELHLDPSHVKYVRADLSSFDGDFTIEPSGPGIFSILIEGRSYQATILAPGVIQVNDRVFDVEIFDPRELRARSNTAAMHGRQSIAAPMPGKVVRVLVAAGDTIEAGQGLIVVEAMKMQNEMKSPKAGTVVEVKTKDGATVAAGEILIVIE
jgi:biotin carboxyl carrier protein